MCVLVSNSYQDCAATHQKELLLLHLVLRCNQHAAFVCGICMYVCVCVWVCVCVCVWVGGWVRACMHVCMYSLCFFKARFVVICCGRVFCFAVVFFTTDNGTTETGNVSISLPHHNKYAMSMFMCIHYSSWLIIITSCQYAAVSFTDPCICTLTPRPLTADHI